MKIFERIKLLADKQGKSLQKVASDLGFGENYIYNLKGAKSPAADKLALIADYFHVSVDYLLGREYNDNQKLDWDSVVEYLTELSDFDYKKMIEVVDRKRGLNE